MQLTKFTDLGLRVLMYVSQYERDKPITISEIATQFNIPRNHLIKVVTFLNKTGWIQTSRGPNGGLRLGIDPASLRLGKAIRVLEGSTALVNCEEPSCPLNGLCGLRHALDQGLNSFYEFMDSYSLQDVISSPTANVIIRLQRNHLAELH